MDPAATPRRVIALDVLAVDAVRVVGRADAETGLARETAAVAAGRPVVAGEHLAVRQVIPRRAFVFVLADHQRLAGSLLVVVAFVAVHCVLPLGDGGGFLRGRPRLGLGWLVSRPLPVPTGLENFTLKYRGGGPRVGRPTARDRARCPGFA